MIPWLPPFGSSIPLVIMKVLTTAMTTEQASAVALEYLILFKSFLDFSVSVAAMTKK